MSAVSEIAVRVVFLLATSIWVGGLVVVAVVAQVTHRTLSTADRVATFRGIGRLYGPFAGCALVIALGLGLFLVRGQWHGGLFVLTCVVAGCLLAVTAIGVVQARAMTRLRSEESDLPVVSAATGIRIVRGGRRAAILRGGIGILTLALIVLGSVLFASPA